MGALKEPYQPLENVADVKVDDDYKTDAVRPFNFQDELDRIRQENEDLKERLYKMETRMTTAEINIEDMNHNAEELRKDVDNSTKYTVELMKIDNSPKKVAKYVNEFHDVKKDVANLKIPTKTTTIDSFAEKLARARLMEDEIQNLRYMMDAISPNDKKA